MHPVEFLPWSAQHWLGLALSLGPALALVWAVRRSGSPRLDLAVRRTLAAACLTSQAFLLIWWWRLGARLANLLPLHICDAAILLAPVVLLTRQWLCYELLYFWGFAGATLALLMPNVTRGFPALYCICFFALHGLIVASALYATAVMRLRPAPRSLLRAWLITNAYALILIPINLALDTNYMFLLRKPAAPSLLDLMGPWPWYIVSGSLLGLVLMALCYLPVHLLRR